MSSADLPLPSRRANFLALARIADVPLVAALALGIYFLTAYALVDRLRIMPVTLNRMVTIREFLVARQAAATRRDVYVVGSSVVVDGVDCNVIDAELPRGNESFNFAWTGAGPQRWLLLEPSLRSSRPAAVVLVVDLTSALHREQVPNDVLAVAGWWEMVSPGDVSNVRQLLRLDPPADNRPLREWLLGLDSPPEELPLADRVLGLDPHPVRLLTSKTADLLQFRVLPVGYLEVTARETLRKDLRFAGHASNLKSPWLRRSVVSSIALQRSVEQVVRQVQDAQPGALDQTLEILRFVDRSLGAADCPTLVAFAPVNPAVARQLPGEYLDEMSRTLARAAAESGEGYVDHSRLLSEGEFSDNVHPFAAGRERWSAALGQAIRARLETRP